MVFLGSPVDPFWGCRGSAILDSSSPFYQPVLPYPHGSPSSSSAERDHKRVRSVEQDPLLCGPDTRPWSTNPSSPTFCPTPLPARLHRRTWVGRDSTVTLMLKSCNAPLFCPRNVRRPETQKTEETETKVCRPRQ